MTKTIIKTWAFLVPVLFAFLLLVGCNESTTPLQSSAKETVDVDADLLAKGGASGQIVVANRASGSISVINVSNDEVRGTFALPAGPNPPEPMYVVFVRQAQRVFVGDRANSRVVVYDVFNYNVEATVPTGAGVFHMWADPAGKQLWVNNDIDNTTTIIDPQSLQVIATVATPADLVAMGGKPHDVILDPRGKFAYVTVLGLSGPSDYVVQYSTRTFEEINRAAVGKDPHVSLTPKNRLLYVPCQNSNAVFVLDRQTMAQVDEIDVAGAHGAGMPVHGNVFYTTNLPGGGVDGLFAIDTRTNEVIGSSDTPFAVPHNIALPTSAKKLYLTHSGSTSDKVTVYSISPKNPLPLFLKEVTVEFNPFGLTFAQ